MAKAKKLTGTVYLIHFNRRYHHAGHYLGFTEGTAEERLDRHVNGRGSPLVKAVVNAGIGVRVVKTWEGETRSFERKLKNRKETPRLCPVCCGAAKAARRPVCRKAA